MAEMQLSGKSGKDSKQQPRIDLTPMVDLGFLLLTFFIMTTTMVKPKAMEIQMPYTPAPPGSTAYYESSAITLMPAADHTIYYYEGLYEKAGAFGIVKGESALRALLQRKQRSLATRANGKERQVQVLIKPHQRATVADIILILDEMTISGIVHYAMSEISPEETLKISNGE